MKKFHRLFRLFTLLVAVCFGFSTFIMAETVTYDGLKYEVHPDEGYAVVIEKISYDYNAKIHEEVEYDNHTYPVTEIGASAFKDQSSLKVNFPATIRKVGADAFKNASIDSVDIADFTAWAQIEFENREANPYYWSKSDQKVLNTYLNGVRISWLQDPEIIIEEPVTRIGSYAFVCMEVRNLKLPDTVTSIGDGAFQGTYIRRLEIPDCVTEIGSNAFYNCSDLSYIKLPESLKEVTRLMLGDCPLLTSVSIPDNVEKIGELAFNSCTSLKSVKFGNVTYFDWNAFQGCTALEQVTVTNISAFMTASFGNAKSNPASIAHNLIVEGMDDGVIDGIPEGVTKVAKDVFFEVYNLKSIRLPDSVDTIEEKAFANCTNLTNIHFGTGLVQIADNALEGCTSLSMASIGASVPPVCTKIDNASGSTLRVPEGRYEAYSTAPGWKDFKYIIADLDAKGQEKFATYVLNSTGDGAMLFKAKDDVVTAFVPSSTYIDGVQYPVTGIATGAFAGNKVLKVVEMPETLQEIGDYAFYNCTSLTTVGFGESLEKIGDSAFAECWTLTGIKLPASLTALGIASFQNCKSVTSVNLQRNLRVVPAMAFAGCTKLHDVSIEEGLESIRESAFRGCLALASLTTPMTLSEIDEYAFADCENIASLKFRPGLAAIGAYAFKNCHSFTMLDIPNGVNYVGECSFWNCKSLRDVYLPASLSSLGASAFYGCNEIADIYSFATEPPICDSYRTTFHHYNSTLHVPQTRIESYAAANEWKKFSRIKDDASYETGIEGTSAPYDEICTVYSADGILLMERASRTDILKLPKGIYIVNDKKLLK